MFDDDAAILISDFLVAQSLLSDRGLSVNDHKIRNHRKPELQLDLPLNLDEMKIRLLQRRSEELIQGHGYADPDGSEDAGGI